MLVLDTHDTAAPGASELLILVVLHVESLGQGLEVLEIFAAHLSEREARCGLLMNQLAEVGLSPHEAIGHAALTAERG